MSENSATTDVGPGNNSPQDMSGDIGNTSGTARNTNSTGNRGAGRFPNRPRASFVQSSTQREFAGATPKIDCVLALQSEIMTKQ